MRSGVGEGSGGGWGDSVTFVIILGVGGRAASQAMIWEGVTVMAGVQLTVILLSPQAPPPLLPDGWAGTKPHHCWDKLPVWNQLWSEREAHYHTQSERNIDTTLQQVASCIASPPQPHCYAIFSLSFYLEALPSCRSSSILGPELPSIDDEFSCQLDNDWQVSKMGTAPFAPDVSAAMKTLLYITLVDCWPPQRRSWDSCSQPLPPNTKTLSQSWSVSKHNPCTYTCV